MYRVTVMLTDGECIQFDEGVFAQAARRIEEYQGMVAHYNITRKEGGDDLGRTPDVCKDDH